MQIIFRGNDVEFTASPVDKDDNPVSPATVYLYLSYVTATGRTTTDPIGMTVSGSDYIGTWDSSSAGAVPGIVYYTVRTTTPNSDEDGEFYLDAFPSNPG